MESLNNCVSEYTYQLSKGKVQKAYKGIINFMSDLKAYLEKKYPDYATGALYYGYMDMTYFAFTPTALKSKKLKIALVFLHEECKFELWLAANNRKIQSDYIELMRHKKIGQYTLSQIQPGVDSIIAVSIVEHPDFDHHEKLSQLIEVKLFEFIKDINTMLL